MNRVTSRPTALRPSSSNVIHRSSREQFTPFATVLGRKTLMNQPAVEVTGTLWRTAIFANACDERSG
jgi:hypothetical protein